MDLQVIVCLSQGPAPVKSTKIGNINPRGRVNKINKQYLTFIPIINYILRSGLRRPKREPLIKIISIIINKIAEAVVFEVKLF